MDSLQGGIMLNFSSIALNCEKKRAWHLSPFFYFRALSCRFIRKNREYKGTIPSLLVLFNAIHIFLVGTCGAWINKNHSPDPRSVTIAVRWYFWISFDHFSPWQNWSKLHSTHLACRYGSFPRKRHAPTCWRQMPWSENDSNSSLPSSIFCVPQGEAMTKTGNGKWAMVMMTIMEGAEKMMFFHLISLNLLNWTFLFFIAEYPNWDSRKNCSETKIK